MTDRTEPTYDEEQLGSDEDVSRALKWSGIVAVIVASAAVAVWTLLPSGDAPVVGEAVEVILPQNRTAPEVEPPKLHFTNVTTESGIDFTHDNQVTGDKLLPETMGGGCAFFDYDNDGDQDLLLVDSNRWPTEPAKPEAPSLRLYTNNGAGHFTDATKEAGIQISCYGMGVAVADYDNDGDPDVFVSAVGANALLRNDAGRFTDVTQETHVAGSDDAWSTSCGFFDYDNDGDLDLFVANYVTWSPEIDIAQDFRLTGVGRAYGPPLSFMGSFPYLYRNDGAEGFTEVAEAAGMHITAPASTAGLAKSLGVRPCDVNNDGWMDLIVANDTTRNLLFLNQQDGAFREVGVESGVAYDSNGMSRGAMGIDAESFRNTDELAIAIGNFSNEMTAFYVSSNQGDLFTDDAIPIGIGPQTRLMLTFGLFFFDVDLDGRLDLFSANGHIENEINRVQASQHYEQPASLFWNAGAAGGDDFVEVKQAGDLHQPLTGRGATYADIDADGDLDVLVTQVGGPPALYRNDQAGAHYLRLKLVGEQTNRDAIGAKITIAVHDEKIERCIVPTRSYLSQVELPVTIGLGDQTQVDSVVVTWPDGQQQQVPEPTLDGLTVVRQEPAP